VTGSPAFHQVWLCDPAQAGQSAPKFTEPA
jgi:hypothetical protein